MNGNIEKPNKLGYTLVELIVVIALIGIVTAIALPSIGLIFNTSEKKELMEFRRDIIYARNSAVMENGIYSIDIDIRGNQYFLMKDNKKDKNLIKSKKFTNGIKLKADNMDHYITFYPTGSPKKAGTVQLSNRKNQKIYMSITPATGKVNLKFDER